VSIAELESIRRTFEELARQHDLRESDCRYDTEEFGNAYVTYTSRELGLRVIRDRGQYSVEVAPAESGDWYDIHLVLLAMQSPGVTETQSGVTNDLKKLAVLAERHLDEIANLFAAERVEETRSLLRDLGQQRASRLLRRRAPP